MWPGPGRGVNGRVLGEMARHRPVSPCPAPRAQRCMQAGGVHSVLAMRAKARTSARRMPGFACDWSANARPRNRSARLCDPRARTRSACDTNSRLVYPTASELARKLGTALGRDWGGAGARHGRTRSQSPPFSAPCTQRCGHRVWCVCVCAKCCCLAVPLSWLQCRLVTPWPPRHSAVETRGCGASHMGARRPPYPARVGENWQANPQLTTTGQLPSVGRSATRLARGALERTGHGTSTTVRVMMRDEREREKRKRMSMGTRSAGAGEVRPGAQAQWVLSSPAPSPSLVRDQPEAMQRGLKLAFRVLLPFREHFRRSAFENGGEPSDVADRRGPRELH